MIVGANSTFDQRPLPPRLNLMKLLGRLVPKATLYDLADALFEQGLEVRGITCAPLAAAPLQEDTNG